MQAIIHTTDGKEHKIDNLTKITAVNIGDRNNSKELSLNDLHFVYDSYCFFGTQTLSINDKHIICAEIK